MNTLIANSLSFFSLNLNTLFRENYINTLELKNY